MKNERIETKDRRGAEIIKSFLALFLCFSSLGFSETSQASIEEQRYKESCDGGDLEACVSLGDLELRRDNYKIAEVFYRRACDERYPEGCYYFGQFLRGRGRYDEGMDAYKKACDGDLVLCVSIGNRMNRRRIVTATDATKVQQAAYFYGKACDGGYLYGCIKLGDLEYEKRDNLNAAAVAYGKACGGGYIESAALEYGLGHREPCYILGNLEIKRGNLNAAVAFYGKSCDLGVSDGCDKLNEVGNLEYERGNTDIALLFFRQGCRDESDEESDEESDPNTLICLLKTSFTKWRCESEESEKYRKKI